MAGLRDAEVIVFLLSLFLLLLLCSFDNTRSDMDSVIFRIIGEMLFFSCTFCDVKGQQGTRENLPLIIDIVHHIVHHFTSSDLEYPNAAESHVRFDAFDAICHHLSHTACIRQGKSVGRSTLLPLPNPHPQGQGPSNRCGSNARLQTYFSSPVTNEPPPLFFPVSSRSGYAQRCCRNPTCRPRTLSGTA
jgi:hypothetical protein